jgi:hypothetical protein
MSRLSVRPIIQIGHGKMLHVNFSDMRYSSIALVVVVDHW